MKVLGLRGLDKKKGKEEEGKKKNQKIGPHVLMPKRLFKFVALNSKGSHQISTQDGRKKIK
jgi:hypothetical protein